MPSVISVASLDSLSVELLECVLSYLRTKELLRVSAVSQKICSSANYLLRQRFRQLEDLNGYHLVFQCSSPSRRKTTPYHTCRNNGSYPTSKNSSGTSGSFLQPHSTTPVSTIYSHFTPIPAGPGRSPPIGTPPCFARASQLVSRTLPFDTSAYFTQLIASVVLAKRVGTVASTVGIFPGQFFRIRRSWLREVGRQKDGEILWLDDDENVGLRLRVRESKSETRMEPLLVFQHKEEEEEETERATSFECIFEAICVRTGYLLGRVEEMWL